MSFDPQQTALILVDVQQAFLEWEAGGLERNNPEALDNISALLQAFRQSGLSVIHVRHASTEADSALRPERSGYQPIAEAQELDDEKVFIKSVNSSFIGTGLDEYLRSNGFETLIIAGITTNHCVETTTRMAGNLGFDARLVEDACYTFARTSWGGGTHSAQDIHTMTLSNLDGEFATIHSTNDILAALGAPKTGAHNAA